MTRVAALLSAFAPAAALACPLCYGSSAPGVLNAYYLSTALLSLLPFTIVGAIALVAFRIVRRDSPRPTVPENGQKP